VYGRGHGPISFGPAFTPPIIQQLLIANIAVFLAQLLFGRDFDVRFALVPQLFWHEGYLWQPFTYMWLHGNFLHLAMNLFTLWMFGSQVAMAWGPRRFLRFYLVCGVGAGLLIATVPALLSWIHPSSFFAYTLGASGAVYGVLLAYSLTWPDRIITLIFPPVAFRAIWLIPGLFFMSLLDRDSNVSHVGHLGGVLVAWIYLQIQGDVHGRLISWSQLKFKLHRWRMRRRLRAVQYQDWEARRREHDRRYH
jgi:membrane associated rhomboid family serine protease